MRIIFLGLIGYLLYRFFTRFLFPLIKVVSRTRKEMNALKNRMEEQNQQQKQQFTSSEESNKIDGEYIDFEEVN